ncbi:MAG TPA: hypothetical protein PK523_02045 [Elusimicrobiales bacterium]|nr:hypothetical protein [Elusimicrobiales bacterium]
MKKILVSIMFMLLAAGFGAMTVSAVLCSNAHAGSTMPDSGDPDPDGGGSGGSGGGPDDTDDGGGCGGGGSGGGSDPDGSGGGVLF